MIELPEAKTIATQLGRTISGKRILECDTGKSDRKWVFYSPSRKKLAELIVNKKVDGVTSRGRSVHIGLIPDQSLVIDEFGGKVLFHPPGVKLPKKSDLLLQFDDQSYLTVVIQMWGFISTLPEWKKNKWVILRTNAVAPDDKSFTVHRLSELIDQYDERNKESIKTFFTNGRSVAGIGNGYLQDILFRAKISPKRKVADISPAEKKALHRAVKDTIKQAVEENGRTSERDIFDKPGRYNPIMDRAAVGKPCPNCRTPIQKISYLGGSCYICPQCQK